MVCTKSLTISPEISDTMGLDQAVYSSSLDKIFAVRGGYVYEFNAATGLKVKSVRFGIPSFGDGSIAWDAGTASIFCTNWNEQRQDDDCNANYETALYKLVYKINPATLATIGTSNITKGVLPYDIYCTQQIAGPHQIIAYGGVLYLIFLVQRGADGYEVILYALNPATLAITDYEICATEYFYAPWIDMCIQPASGPTPANIWCTHGTNGMVPRATTDLEYVTSTYWAVDTTALIAAPYPISYGICWCAANGSIYATTRTQRVIYFTPSTVAPAAAVFNTTDSNAVPYRIRYCNEPANPFYQKILVPGGPSNNVAVVTPTTHAVTLKSGFDSPFDVVFTTTRAFAVQHGDVPLRQIT